MLAVNSRRAARGSAARHTAAAAALGLAATLLVACAGAATDGDNESSAQTSSSTAPVSVDPAAPKLTEVVSAYNFIRTTDDGSMRMLATVHVKSAKGWLGLADEKGQFTTLEKGKYTVQARGASGCSGVGSPAAEGLGVIGEVHVDSDRQADVWNVPAKIDADSLTTVALVDSEGNLASCAKTVQWTEPSEENQS